MTYTIVKTIGTVQLREVIDSKPVKYCLYDTASESIIVDCDYYTTFVPEDEFFELDRFYILKRFCDRGYRLTVCDARAENPDKMVIVNDWQLVPYIGKSEKQYVKMVKSPLDGKIYIFDSKLYGTANDIFNFSIDNYRAINKYSLIITNNGKRGYYARRDGFIPFEYDEVRYAMEG